MGEEGFRRRKARGAALRRAERGRERAIADQTHPRGAPRGWTSSPSSLSKKIFPSPVPSLRAPQRRAIEVAHAGRLRLLQKKEIEFLPVPMGIGDLVVRARGDEELVAAVGGSRKRPAFLVAIEREAALEADGEVRIRRLPAAPRGERQEARKVPARRRSPRGGGSRGARWTRRSRSADARPSRAGRPTAPRAARRARGGSRRSRSRRSRRRRTRSRAGGTEGEKEEGGRGRFL